MKKRLAEETIARRVAAEFRDGMIINLGYGMPTTCAAFVPKELGIFFQAENGVLGYGPPSLDAEKDYELIDASDTPVTHAPGMCFFDSGISFDMIRGGHIDLVVMGAYQVSKTGDLANWGRPGRPATGMGGAMDLAAGSKQVFIMMLHTTKDGGPRIVNQCTFPLTAKGCVKKIFTDLAVIDVAGEGLVLREIASGWCPEDVQALTEPALIVAADLKEIQAG
jgi:3-oxoacid CoA-transferase subunit B